MIACSCWTDSRAFRLPSCYMVYFTCVYFTISNSLRDFLWATATDGVKSFMSADTAYQQHMPPYKMPAHCLLEKACKLEVCIWVFNMDPWKCLISVHVWIAFLHKNPQPQRCAVYGFHSSKWALRLGFSHFRPSHAIVLQNTLFSQLDIMNNDQIIILNQLFMLENERETLLSWWREFKHSVRPFPCGDQTAIGQYLSSWILFYGSEFRGALFSWESQAPLSSGDHRFLRK